jgi:transcriptional regulator with XRE-family HTH domain
MSRIFPDRLRTARQTKGYSQTDLAKRTEMQPSAISHFENGRRLPSFENLRRLAETLGVSIDYLLGRVEEPKNSGQVVEQFFRHLSEMSDDDKEILAATAKALAERNKKRRR